jgi:hypothetical protein
VRPILGIELDDKSHDRPERKTRDELVVNVFAAASLPLVRIPVKTGYSTSDVATLIKPYLDSTPAPTLVPTTASPAPSTMKDDSSPTCPKCGSKMVLRTAKSGANAGGQFWGCANFPRCRSVLAIKAKP